MSTRLGKLVRRQSARGRASNRSRASAGRRSLLGTIGLFVGVSVVAFLAVLVVGDEPPSRSQSAPAVVWNGGRVRVDVQNGGGVAGMARSAMEILRPAGFDVVSFGNAPSFDPERPSVVIDRVGRLSEARAVANALGIDNVLSEPDPNLYVDVTVVVGGAWHPGAREAISATPRSESWWDLRSRLGF